MENLHRKQLINEIHAEAIAAASQFFNSEARLLTILQRMDELRAYRDLGHTSLMAYAVKSLKLSESTALNLINVARKAVQVPELKREIEAGELSVCMARKIVPVLTQANQSLWIEKAKTLTTRALEREVATVRPQEATPERIKFVTAQRVAMSIGLNEPALQALRRVQDLESQRQMRPVSLEDTVIALCAVYLEKNDPIAKAARARRRAEEKANTQNKTETSGKGESAAGPSVQATPPEPTLRTPKAINSDVTRQTRTPIPARVLHEVQLRDGSQCAHRDLTGHRCAQRRWLQIHHIVPVVRGGGNEPGNLLTLCSAHHQMEHSAYLRGQRSASSVNRCTWPMQALRRSLTSRLSFSPCALV
jgi:hypothetical protein